MTGVRKKTKSLCRSMDFSIGQISLDPHMDAKPYPPPPSSPLPLPSHAKPCIHTPREGLADYSRGCLLLLLDLLPISGPTGQPVGFQSGHIELAGRYAAPAH